MTYFGFLLIFLVMPILIFAGMNWLDSRRGKQLPERLQSWPVWAAIALHIVIALLYTTLWDNYLVATRVWWYDPELVTGFTIGWVPIEEYTFFILQPILASLWMLFLACRIKVVSSAANAPVRLRVWSVGGTAVIWLISVIILAVSWQPGNYLALELGWALPPIALQLAFGADILWRYRRIVLWTIVPMTLYLATADALAICWGTWTINPQKSLNIFLGGVLPIEEFIFFLLTNILLTFGVVLVLARESHGRIGDMRQRFTHSGTVANESEMVQR